MLVTAAQKSHHPGVACATPSGMSRVAFDTLAFAKHLQEAGVLAVQAGAHATAQADFLTHHLLIEVATKSDLAEVQAELKADLDGIRVKLADMETRLSLRMLFMVGTLGALMSLFKFMG